jgi:hypothetical protein
VYCDTPDDIGVPANWGTWCRQRSDGAACTHAEVDADCLTTLESIECSLHQDLYTEYL